MARGTFDYACPTHGVFERMFDERHEFVPCDICGERAEQIWTAFPNMDTTALAFWNNYHDNRLGTFTDKRKYGEAVERAGYRIKEPGSDADAEANGRKYVEKREKELKDKIGKFFQERTLDEIRRGIAVDKEIFDAQNARDENKLKAMGAPTSLDECYKRANSE